MVRTISKMFLKRRIVLTSLTRTLHFSRAHHWLLHRFPPLSTCSSHLYFSRPCYLLCIFLPSGLVSPLLARVSRLSLWLHFSRPHHWLLHNFSSACFTFVTVVLFSRPCHLVCAFQLSCFVFLCSAILNWVVMLSV